MEKIACDIRRAGVTTAPDSNAESRDLSTLKEYVNLSQQNADFRCECAQSSAVWISLHDSLQTSFQKSDLFSEDRELLLLLLRLIQFLLAGEPEFRMSTETDTLDMDTVGGTLRQTLRKLWNAHGTQGTCYKEDMGSAEDLEQLRLTCLRGLANYSTIASGPGLASTWNCILDDNGPFIKMTTSWRTEYLHPTLHILVRCRNFVSSFLSRNCDTAGMQKTLRVNGLRIFRQILLAASDFWNDDQSLIFTMIYNLLVYLFEYVTLSDLWTDLAEASTSEKEDPVEEQHELRAKVVLMKFADGMIHDSMVDLKGLRLEYMISTMREVVQGKVSMIFVGSNTFNLEEVGDIASLAQLHLGIFKKYFPLTAVLIEFLGLLVKYIPRRGLTTSSPTASQGSLPSSVTDLFKGMKRDLIEILTLFMSLDKRLQDLIRELEGVQLILSQCNIDDDNPYIKERAVLCVRGLMEENPQNQALVRDLQVLGQDP